MIGTEGNILATERFKGDDTQYYLYNKDIQGSTSILIKEDGSADATYQYTDYGETIIHGDDQAKNEVCYTGGIYDQSTGLYYLNARYYNPEDGRFMTEDTYRGDTTKSETGHLYVYCANNPVNAIEPNGKLPVFLVPLIKGAVGAVVDAAAQVTVSMANGQGFGEAMSNIDYTSVGASFVASAIAMPGMSTGRKIVTGVAAVADVALDINVKGEINSVGAIVGEKNHMVKSL